jgi:integrase
MVGLRQDDQAQAVEDGQAGGDPRRRDAAGGRLDAIPKRSTIILANSKGRPWTSDGFRSSFWTALDKVGIEDLRFHDLRGTAVTRLALSGCSVPQIAAITGHSLKDVEALLDAHYLGGRAELAEQAALMLESRFGEKQ